MSARRQLPEPSGGLTAAQAEMLQRMPTVMQSESKRAPRLASAGLTRNAPTQPTGAGANVDLAAGVCVPGASSTWASRAAMGENPPAGLLARRGVSAVPKRRSSLAARGNNATKLRLTDVVAARSAARMWLQAHANRAPLAPNAGPRKAACSWLSKLEDTIGVSADVTPERSPPESSPTSRPDTMEVQPPRQKACDGEEP